MLTKLYKLINVCYEDYVNGTYSQSYQMNQENSQQKAIEEYARTGKKQDASLLEIAGNALMAKIDSKAAASNFNNIVATELIKLIDSIYNLKLEGFYNAKHEFLLAFLNILKMKNELDTSLLTKESIQRDIQALEKINPIPNKNINDKPTTIIISLFNTTPKKSIISPNPTHAKSATLLPFLSLFDLISPVLSIFVFI